MQRNVTKGIPSEGSGQANQCCNFDPADKAALPEQFPESASQRQTISVGRTAFDLSHDQGGAKNNGETEHFVCEPIAERKNSACGANKLLQHDSTAESEPGHESRVNQQTPAAAHSFVVQKNLTEDSSGRRGLKAGSWGRTREWFEV